MVPLLEIRDLHASVGDTPILKGINLTINAGEIHAIMGPNGSGKSTMSYVLAGRDGYEVTGGDILMNGVSMLEMESDERARAGMFLAFQYPVELPGVGGMSFLRAAVNARRIEAGEDEIDQLEFVKLVRESNFHGNKNTHNHCFLIFWKFSVSSNSEILTESNIKSCFYRKSKWSTRTTFMRYLSKEVTQQI